MYRIAESPIRAFSSCHLARRCGRDLASGSRWGAPGDLPKRHLEPPSDSDIHPQRRHREPGSKVTAATQKY
eukprot:2701808-Pyramimonas_sp.AAC.2